MSDAELESALFHIDRENFPENYSAAKNEFDSRKVSAQTNALPVYRMEFHGTAIGYFRIWIVNLFLSIITLGIFSAWAKVRKRRYFLGNTVLHGSNFDYHADPIKILKGRLFVGAVFVGIYLMDYLIPQLSYVTFLLFWLVFPWLIVRSSSFYFHNTSYRGIRFGFKNDYAGAYKVGIKVVLLLLFTLGLGYPFMVYFNKNFKISSTRFGKTYFEFKARSNIFFSTYVLTLFAFLAAFVTAVVLGILVPDKGLKTAVVVIALWGGSLFAICYGIAKQWKLTINAIAIADFRFESQIQTEKLFWIYVSNLILIMLSVGLLVPWAAIRLQKFYVDSLLFHAPAEAIDRFEVAELKTVDASGDAAADFWDIDIGI